MRIPVNILVFYIIVGLSFVHGTLSRGIALDLSLMGPLASGALEFLPLALVFTYAVFALVTRKSSAQSVWLGGAVGAIILAIVGTYYPDWLVERCSRKIEVSSYVKGEDMFLPADEVTRFEQTFGTPTSQYSDGETWLIVLRDKYTPAMIAFLTERTQQKAEPPQAADPARPP